jgi:hypothetical protein
MSHEDVGFRVCRLQKGGVGWSLSSQTVDVASLMIVAEVTGRLKSTVQESTSISNAQ